MTHQGVGAKQTTDAKMLICSILQMLEAPNLKHLMTDAFSTANHPFFCRLENLRSLKSGRDRLPRDLSSLSGLEKLVLSSRVCMTEAASHCLLPLQRLKEATFDNYTVEHVERFEGLAQLKRWASHNFGLTKFQRKVALLF